MFIERYAMLHNAAGVLVAVSGGADSVALLDILARISLGDNGWPSEHSDEPSIESTKAQALVRRLYIHVAHLDHMLRGGESAEDSEFVREFAEGLGLQITIDSVDVRAAASRSGRGIEETARELRYDFLLATAKNTGCDRIAVGHTMTDQAETFLMRLIRGAGMRGLAAMRPVIPAHRFSVERANLQGSEGAAGIEDASVSSSPSNALPCDSLVPSVLMIRPLLCITREEVEAYCSRRELKFRIDATNLSLHYTRNRIRKEVLPELAAINPKVVESISRAAGNIAGDQDELERLALSLLENARLASTGWDTVGDQIVTAYSVAVLLEQPPAIRRRMIIESIRLGLAGAGSAEREDDGELGFVHVAAVEGLLTKPSGKHISLPGSLEVWREYDALVVKHIGVPEPPYQTELSSEYPVVEAGGIAFTLQRALPAELLRSVMEEVRKERRATGRDWMAVGLDDRVMPARMVLRPRLRGERAHVIGQRRTIKLKNLMIDHRIPSSRRAIWPIVTTPDGAYIWSPGLPPAVEFAAHEKSQSLAIVRASAI